MTELTTFLPRTRGDLFVELVDGHHAVAAQVDELDHLALRCAAPVTARGAWLSSRLASHFAGMPWAVLVRGPYGDLRAAAVFVDVDGPLGSTTTTFLSGGDGHRAAVPALDDHALHALVESLSVRLMSRSHTGQVALGPLSSFATASTLAASMPLTATVTAGDAVPLLHREESTVAEDYLSTGLRRTVRKARNRMAADGVTMRVSFTTNGAEIVDLIPAMAAAHLDRDRMHGIEGVLDDELAAIQWRDRICGLLDAGGLEVATLRVDGELASYVIGIRDGESYRVLEGCFVTRWARYAPGRLLETAVLQRVLDDRRFTTLDWMTGIAPESILATNALEPAVTLTCGLDPFTDVGGY